MKKADIVFIHLLNDHSGSPKVLKEVIGAVCAHGELEGKLYVGSSGEGFLSSCDIPTIRYWYQRTGHRILTLFTFFLSQAILFWKLLFDRPIDKRAVIYVNTLLPFGAALYGKLTGRKVIYHMHEISVTPAPLKCLLTGIARMTSSLNLYVSDAHMAALLIPGPPARRIYNALDANILEKAYNSVYSHLHSGRFNVLMLASLRDYKGVDEYVELAVALQKRAEIHFDLVANDYAAAIERYFSSRPQPSNLTVHPRTTNTAQFYGRASLVLNLSRVDQWVETFGLTILEAMAFGIPVLVPPVGGPSEIIADGVQGFHVDSRDHTQLCDRVLQLSADPGLCLRMSQAGRARAADFSPLIFAETIRSIIEQMRIGKK